MGNVFPGSHDNLREVNLDLKYYYSISKLIWSTEAETLYMETQAILGYSELHLWAAAVMTYVCNNGLRSSTAMAVSGFLPILIKIDAHNLSTSMAIC